jgi:hypothetical protein
MASKRSLCLGALASAAAFALTGCSSSTPPESPTIQPAKTYALRRFTLGTHLAAGRPARMSFAIREPSGAALTSYRRGDGPHTGVHLIVVRSDLGVLIHRHPPIRQDGRIEQTLVFPTPGRYRVVVDAYPKAGSQPNLQLFRWVTIPGDAPDRSLPPLATTTTVDGYRFMLQGRPHLKAIQAAFLTITVRRPDGSPATFTPWYGPSPMRSSFASARSTTSIPTCVARERVAVPPPSARRRSPDARRLRGSSPSACSSR